MICIVDNCDCRLLLLPREDPNQLRRTETIACAGNKELRNREPFEVIRWPRLTATDGYQRIAQVGDRDGRPALIGRKVRPHPAPHRFAHQRDRTVSVRQPVGGCPMDGEQCWETVRAAPPCLGIAIVEGHGRVAGGGQAVTHGDHERVQLSGPGPGRQQNRGRAQNP